MFFSVLAGLLPIALIGRAAANCSAGACSITPGLDASAMRYVSPLGFESRITPGATYANTTAYRIVRIVHHCVCELSRNVLLAQAGGRQGQMASSSTNASARVNIVSYLQLIRAYVPPIIFEPYNMALRAGRYADCVALLTSIVSPDVSQSQQLREFIRLKNCQFNSSNLPCGIAFFDLDARTLAPVNLWVVKVVDGCESDNYNMCLFLPKSVLSIDTHLATSLHVDIVIMQTLAFLDDGAFNTIFLEQYRTFKTILFMLSESQRKIYLLRLKYFTFTAIAALVSMVQKNTKFEVSACYTISGVFDSSYDKFFSLFAKCMGITTK